MLAILAGAISCFQKLSPQRECTEGRNSSRLRISGAVTGKTGRSRIVTFEALGFDPNCLRRGLLCRVKTRQALPGEKRTVSR
jgi:hypothetical protein